MTNLSHKKLDVEQACDLQSEIYTELASLAAKENELDHSYVRLGALLVLYKQSESWRAHGYANFDDFMEGLRARFNRARKTLYKYLGVVENLLPVVTAEDLNDIGISKAMELKYALSFPGRKITPEVLAAAKDENVTVKQLRAVLHLEYTLPPDQRPTGTWFDCGGWYMDKEERVEFVEAIKVGMAVLGIRKETPEWQQRKLIIMTALQEFLAAHGPEVYGPTIEQEEAH